MRTEQIESLYLFVKFKLTFDTDYITDIFDCSLKYFKNKFDKSVLDIYEQLNIIDYVLQGKNLNEVKKLI